MLAHVGLHRQPFETTATSRLWLVLAGFTAICMAGCSGDDGPQLAPVSGIVLYNGQPVNGAVVEFVQPGAPLRSIGYTDESGAFKITSMSPGDGAIVGVNKVTVIKRTRVDHPAADVLQAVPLDSIADPNERRLASMKNSVAEKTAANEAGRERSKKPSDLLPPKFAKTETSGLEFDVKPDGLNEFQIVLSD